MKLPTAALFVLMSTVASQAQEPAKSVALTPVPRSEEQWWVQRHEKCVAITKAGGVDVAFLGDSITQGWENQPAWATHFQPLKAANFGFSLVFRRSVSSFQLSGSW